MNVKFSNYTYTDGRTVGMLEVDGLVPMSYSGTNYFIPVNLWIPEDYPKRGPICYVSPTSNMVLAQDHPYMDRSGHITTLYLVYWNPERSNLIGTINDLRTVFSQKTPVYARENQTKNNTMFQGLNPSSHQTVVNPYSKRPEGKLSLESQRSVGIDHETANRLYRNLMIKALIARANGSMMDIIEQSQPELTRLASEKSLLSERANQLANEVLRLQNTRTAIEHNISTMGAIMTEISTWEDRLHLPSSSTTNAVKAKEVLVPVDPLTTQFLECQSEDVAIEETLNVLDVLLQKDKIDVESYLKQVRKLGRRQFYARALSIKIGNLQHR
eukprot:g9191.t1